MEINIDLGSLRIIKTAMDREKYNTGLI